MRRLSLILADLLLFAPACHRPRAHCGLSWAVGR